MKNNLIEENNEFEVLVENLGCWNLEHNGIINQSCANKTILVLKKIKYVDYLKIKNKYPLIYLGDGLVTKYNSFFDGYIFMPTVEYSTEEKCYIKHLEDDILLDVIFDSFSYLDNDYKEINSKQIESKTYLMIDGNGYVKIGKSFSPSARERTLQSENPTIELIAYCNIDIEKKLHVDYKEKRKRGEWFILSKSDIKNIIKKYKFEKNV